MPASDFPPELWSEIIDYLPRGDLRKMIGVNRFLFELALNDLYEEVRFTSDDKHMSRVFEQLSHPNICTRTRRLLVRPTFLPTLEENCEISVGELLSVKVSSYLSRIGEKFPLERFTITKPQGIFPRAQKVVRSCVSVNEVTIILHDQALTLQFMAFWDSLWTARSLGPNIRKLSIDTTVAKLPFLLNSIFRRKKVISELEVFNITISSTRLGVDSAMWDAASASLVSFLSAFKHSLTSFTFSSLLDRDISNLFASFPHLQRLRAFEFLSVFNAAVFSTPESLTDFISMHANTLNNLVIKPHARSVTLHKSDVSYTAWLSSAVTERKSDSGFSSLSLPQLRTLDLGLGEYWNEFGTGRQYPLPDFARITPNLTSLSLADTKLSNESVIALLDILSRREEGSLLEKLAFPCYVIFPELFDLLHKAVPCLKALSIQHISYIPVMGNVTRYFGRSEDAFAEKLNARTYAGSQLQYIRLASPPSSCGATHPNVALMKHLALALPNDVVLDNRVECQCLM
ncbi:hypothetical protein HYPSUDRAFT_91565 [Hypholoma sublateritium FD-334 SS-4]|uniref:F-box domain-containing protein n=1 Tax=Hypholoma sublateritium (strain FD-334 SS-4) TaxID=945553 RepID=A0A0D2NHD6_HYPSF|nr:hypothetical protein HYPSUDRAFT_91565 [Hypholoma sublateritium FD-334 SS-4]